MIGAEKFRAWLRHPGLNGKDSPPPPDYTPIAAANEVSAKYSKEAADADLAFRKQVYEESKPAQSALADLAGKIAQQQLDAGETATARSDAQWADYQANGKPAIQTMYDEAAAYGNEADQTQQAGNAASAIRQAGRQNEDNTQRTLTSMGVNPNSGRAASVLSQTGLGTSLAAAKGGNDARTLAKDKGISLRAGVASFANGQTNVAGQQVGLATQAQNSATGNQSAAFSSALPYAQYVSGGVGAQQNAAGQSINANLGLGGLMSGDYKALAGADDGTGALIGAAGSVASAFIL
jgi:hypothetical protein